MKKNSLKAAPVKTLNTFLAGVLATGLIATPVVPVQARELSHDPGSKTPAAKAPKKQQTPKDPTGKEGLKTQWAPPIGKNLQDLSERGTTTYEKLWLEYLAFTINTNSFDDFMANNLTIAKILPVIGGKIRDVPADTVDLGMQIAEEAARMLVEMRGLSKKYPNIKYLEWKDLSRWMKLRMDAQEEARRAPFKNDVQDSRYMSELYDLAETSPARAREFKILVDGPQSFAKRDVLIDNAKESIDLATWAVLDDETGNELRDQLIRKHNQGVKVRLMVDGQVNRRKGYSQAVKEMEKAGVPVMRWFHPTIPFVGQHRKMMIVDGTYMVAGGLNPGNTYSHKAGDPKNHWRDTDFYATGDFVNQGNKLFAKLWNEQIKWHNLKLQPMSTAQSQITGGNIPVSLVEYMPSAEKPTGSTIMMSMLKAIRGAQTSIDIENAYVIMFPELQHELTQAISRGVKIRVLSNSDMSVDEAIISQPMMRSAKRMASIGAEVYQRKGSTLHSKFMVIDNQIVIIGSYNLHPRSERVEGEIVAVVDDRATAQTFTDTFNKDINPSIAKLSKESDIKVSEGVMLDATLRMFFDLL
jgi:Phosphatidylserine/phosphatidylglycerophosphate/cardiolipin synthases and related enzymes